MEPRPLTTWEQKERDGLLALETDAWREKRLVAEDPNTTADVLTALTARLAHDFHNYLNGLLLTQRKALKGDNLVLAELALLTEAIAAHPNTTIETLRQLFWETSRSDQSQPKFYDSGFLKLWACFTSSAKGLCRNPVLPFLLLEEPSFWLNVNRTSCLLLLGEEALPRSTAISLTGYWEERVAEAALFHVSLTNNPPTRVGGRAELTRFWRERRAQEKTIRSVATWKQKLHWGRERLATVQASPRDHGFLSDAALAELKDFLGFRSPSVCFATQMRGKFHKLPFLYRGALSNDWMERLNAALGLALPPDPFSYDVWNRSPLELMQHLSRDGNRFVRWAAQTQLDDPNFVFTWYEGE